MVVLWIQPRPYLFPQHAQEHTDSETKNQSLDRRWKGYREERVSAQMAEVMERILSQTQWQHHELHQERAATMSMSTRKQYLKNTTLCRRLDFFYSQKM